MNYKRSELIQADATMNQIRNAIYHLARFMLVNGVDNRKERLRRMGKNIARTYLNYWKPIEEVDLINLKDVISTIYNQILNSSISVELNEAEMLVVVKDQNCALCKYEYDEVEIAGCEIIIGLVSELINLINRGEDGEKLNNLEIEPINVLESRAYGNNTCTQVYKYKMVNQ